MVQNSANVQFTKHCTRYHLNLQSAIDYFEMKKVIASAHGLWLWEKNQKQNMSDHFIVMKCYCVHKLNVDIKSVQAYKSNNWFVLVKRLETIAPIEPDPPTYMHSVCITQRCWPTSWNRFREFFLITFIALGISFVCHVMRMTSNSCLVHVK